MGNDWKQTLFISVVTAVIAAGLSNVGTCYQLDRAADNDLVRDVRPLRIKAYPAFIQTALDVNEMSGRCYRPHYQPAVTTTPFPSWLMPPPFNTLELQLAQQRAELLVIGSKEVVDAVTMFEKGRGQMAYLWTEDNPYVMAQLPEFQAIVAAMRRDIWAMRPAEQLDATQVDALMQGPIQRQVDMQKTPCIEH